MLLQLDTDEKKISIDNKSVTEAAYTISAGIFNITGFTFHADMDFAQLRQVGNRIVLTLDVNAQVADQFGTETKVKFTVPFVLEFTYKLQPAA